MDDDPDPDGVIRVWPVRLDAPPDDLALEVLSAEERWRARRYHEPRDRDRFIVARATLRRVLARELDWSPADLRLARGEWGKPCLADLPAPRFNVSRSADLAVIALCREHEVGVDVERLRPIPDARALARAYFSPAERDAIDQCAPEARDAEFLRIWTRKEAIIKGTGHGLAVPLESFDVLASTDDSVICLENGDRWFVRTFSPADGYIAAIATPSSTARLELQTAP